jgi:D-galactarolactone isomerase
LEREDTVTDLDGACDCRVHVFDEGWALAPTVTFKPPHAPASAYRAVQQALGLQRVVVVQPIGNGFDNGCTLAALRQLGPGASGVAMVSPNVPDGELERLHQAGMRGVRFMGLAHQPAAERPRAAAARTMLRDLPCRLVIDHIGKFLSPVQPGCEGLLALHRLLVPAATTPMSARWCTTWPRATPSAACGPATGRTRTSGPSRRTKC